LRAQCWLAALPNSRNHNHPKWFGFASMDNAELEILLLPKSLRLIARIVLEESMIRLMR
jgi:hypothetical protein